MLEPFSKFGCPCDNVSTNLKTVRTLLQQTAPSKLFGRYYDSRFFNSKHIVSVVEGRN